jgi:hypothetical protein
MAAIPAFVKSVGNWFKPLRSAAVGLELLATASASAQSSTSVKIHGDTTRAPRGCSAASATSAISAWFAAFNDADSARLAKASSTPNGRFVFSVGKFATSDKFVRGRTFEEKGGKTLVVLRESYPTKEALDAAGTGAADAMVETFDQLDELLVALGESTG